MKNFKGNLNNAGLASFNQSLFESQACFNDVVWVIDLSAESVDILSDHINPETVGMRFSLEEIRARIKARYPGENKNIVNRYSVEYLQELKETIYFNNPTFLSAGKRFKLKQAMTPEVDADGNTVRVYVTAINTQNFISSGKEKSDIYKTVSMILSHAKNHAQSIQDVLQYLGDSLNVGRVYIFENDSNAPGFGSNTFEWCAQGVIPKKDSLQHVSYAEYGYEAIFSQAQLYCCADIAEIQDEQMREIFREQGIYAFMNYAFYDNDELAGFIGIDDCRISREDWDPESEGVELLTYVADLLSTYLIKERNLVHALEAEQAEKELRQKENETRTLLNYFVEGYTSAYLVNLKERTFEILHMAHEFQQVFTMNGGLADMARFVENHVHPDDREMARQMTDPDYIRERLKEENEITFTLREQYGGIERVMHVMIVRVLDPDHTAIGFMDVTGELQKEKELNEKLESANAALKRDQEQSKIIKTLSTSFDSVYYVDLTTLTYTRVAEKEESAMVFPDIGPWEESFAKYIEIFMMPEYQPRFSVLLEKEKAQKILSDNQKYIQEYQRMDNKWRRAYFIPSEYNEKGEVAGFVFAVQNIEASKQREMEVQKALKEAYEAAQMASQAKSTFLANMSHDIRTPMNAIIGMTAIAGAHLNDPEKVADCLKKINSSGRHLLGLINQVLDMSKIESGKIDLAEEDFSLSELMDEVIAMNNPLVKAKGHELTIQVEDLVHERVIGDRTRLEQVLNNLLSNAIKYTPDGGKIEVIFSEKETKKQNNGWYEIIVRDNGIGMTEDFQKTIFEPFSRAVDERANSVQGTGLGMSITRNIVRMMNGDIKVESELNKGSTFKVTFSLKLQNTQDVCYEDFVDLSVLVVDDNEEFCESTCVMLDSLAMKSEYVTSGEAAVNLTVERHEKEDDFYAIIMDWKMPGMDGVEATRQIRARVGKEVPIIVLTSYDWTEIETEAKEAGVNAFLSKPLFKSRVIELFHELHVGKSNASNMLQADQMKQEFVGKRILMAEDNELNREIAVELLSMTGVEVETAEDGSICVDMFNEKEPGYYNLIFMDIQMPVMDGYDAARGIRSSNHPDAQTIPIIALSANAFSSDIRAALESGMNGHLAKPIDMEHVMKTMREYLK